MSTSIRAARPNLNPKSLPTLALAGRANITFRNNEQLTHMNVRIKQLRDKQDRKKMVPIYYVYISLLQDGRTGMDFAGTLFAEGMGIKLGRGVQPDSRLARALNWVVAAIKNPEILRGRVGLFHEGRCCKCGLPLTHPESIHTALGPVCLERMVAAAQRENIRIEDIFTPVESM